VSRASGRGGGKAKARGVPALLWFLAGGIVAIVAIFGFPAVRNALEHAKDSTVEHARALGGAVTKAGPAAAGTAGAHFDFYRLLSHPTQILTSGESNEVAQTPAAQPVAQPGAYVLQVASFRDDSDAEALKAQLALWGIAPSSVESVEVQGETWHRVRVGPVSDLATLNALREKLSAHKLQPLLIRVGG
jgi:SPOR domain